MGKPPPVTLKKTTSILLGFRQMRLAVRLNLYVMELSPLHSCREIKMNDDVGNNFVELAAELTAAWLANANNRIEADQVPAFLRSMHATLLELENPQSADAEKATAEQDETLSPAVSVRKSLASKDHIISMIDGKPYRTLRRHLSTHGMTPETYRVRYGLKPDYPMVAPAYSEQRRAMAKKIGLGRKSKAGK